MPEPVEISVSYSLGGKVGLPNYSSQDFHVSRTERWNVDGLSDEEVSVFYGERFGVLKEEVTELALAEWKEANE